jgi:hypothetical protein
VVNELFGSHPQPELGLAMQDGGGLKSLRCIGGHMATCLAKFYFLT